MYLAIPNIDKLFRISFGMKSPIKTDDEDLSILPLFLWK